MKFKDLTDQKINKWTVLYRIKEDRKGDIKWMCRCECGIEKPVWGWHIRKGNSKSCGCCSILCGSKHKDWNGYGDISGDFWDSIKRGALGGRRKTIEFLITIEYAWNLFIKQNKKCALSGLDLNFNFRQKRYKTKIKFGEHTASLDRIDSSKGYIEGNVQWIHKDINMMKRTYSQEYFIEMCKKIAEYKTNG